MPAELKSRDNVKHASGTGRWCSTSKRRKDWMSKEPIHFLRILIAAIRSCFSSPRAPPHCSPPMEPFILLRGHTSLMQNTLQCQSEFSQVSSTANYLLSILISGCNLLTNSSAESLIIIWKHTISILNYSINEEREIYIGIESQCGEAG